MNELYPFCLNSRRWLTVFFYLSLPKSCPAVAGGDVDCEYEECVYFEWKEGTPYIKKLKRIFNLYEMDLISPKEEEDE